MYVVTIHFFINGILKGDHIGIPFCSYSKIFTLLICPVNKSGTFTFRSTGYLHIGSILLLRLGKTDQHTRISMNKLERL